jgi:hypothetical protein
MSDEKKGTNGLKIILGILIALLLGAGAFMFKMSGDATKIQTELTTEKELLNSELNTLMKQYDEKIAANEILNQDLVDERDRLALTMDSLQESQVTVAGLLRYKSRFIQMKKDRDRLFVENEILVAENANLQETVSIKNSELQNKVAVIDSLAGENIAQANTILTAKELALVGLSGSGVIVKSSGKQTATAKARRTDKVKICFAIPENKIADEGDRMYYIQVIDPKRNVIGDKETITVGGKSLTYSAKTKVFYQKKTLDICEYISSAKFEKGTYVINIFDGEKSISGTNFILN